MRKIRLKELPRSKVSHFSPPDTYVPPGYLERRVYLTEVDKDGFIVSGESDPDDPAIVFLGDSILEMKYVDPQDRFTSSYEKFLRDNSIRVRVLNGGVTGCTTLHALNSLINKVVPIKPIAVVVLLGQMDVDTMCYKETYWAETPFLSPIEGGG